MRIDVVTLFPEALEGPLGHSILGRAVEKGLVDIRLWNLREFTDDLHRTADDAPYGGGAGMVLKPEPFFKAAETIFADWGTREASRVLLTTPQGRVFDQEFAEELGDSERFLILCGHYESVDERVREHLATDEVSIGDYVLTGGELAAAVIIDATVRLLPGVVGEGDSTVMESFSGFLLEHPHYTRPAEFRGWRVPDVLLSGHHEEVRRWRLKMALKRTLERRADLLEATELTDEEQALLEEIGQELAAQAEQPNGGPEDGRYQSD